MLPKIYDTSLSHLPTRALSRVWFFFKISMCRFSLTHYVSVSRIVKMGICLRHGGGEPPWLRESPSVNVHNALLPTRIAPLLWKKNIRDGSHSWGGRAGFLTVIFLQKHPTALSQKKPIILISHSKLFGGGDFSTSFEFSYTKNKPVTQVRWNYPVGVTDSGLIRLSLLKQNILKKREYANAANPFSISSITAFSSDSNRIKTSKIRENNAIKKNFFLLFGCYASDCNITWRCTWKLHMKIMQSKKYLFLLGCYTIDCNITWRRTNRRSKKKR